MQQEIVIRYLARVFVRNPPLNATAQGYADFVNAIGDPSLVPRPVLEMTPIGPVQRIGVGTASGDWLVQVTGDSVDVQSSPQVGMPAMDFEEFCKRAGVQISKALASFDQKAWRLAVVREWVFRELTEEQMNASRARLVTLPKVLADTLPFEWDWRAGAALDRRIGEKMARTNTLASIRRVPVTLGGIEHDRLLLSTDVNTSPKDPTARFDDADALAFCHESPAWHAELKQSMLELAGLQ